MAYVIVADYPHLIPIGLKADTIHGLIEAACKQAEEQGKDDPLVTIPILAPPKGEVGDEEGKVFFPPGFQSTTALRLTVSEIRVIVDAEWDEDLKDPESQPNKKPEDDEE